MKSYYTRLCDSTHSNSFHTFLQVYLLINFSLERWVCDVIDLGTWTITIYDSSVSYTFEKRLLVERIERFTRGVPLLLQQSTYWADIGSVPRSDPLTLVRWVDIPQ